MSYFKTFRSLGPLLFATWHKLLVAAVIEFFGFVIWVLASSDKTAPLAIMLNDLPREAFVGAGLGFLIVAEFLVLHEVRKQRDALKNVTDYEVALDGLAVLFDEGNDEILNGAVGSDFDCATLKSSWDDWRERIERYLELHFGQREQLLFRNSVLVKTSILSGYNTEHIWIKNQMAHKLAMLRKTLLRHSDQAAKWRAEIE